MNTSTISVWSVAPVTVGNSRTQPTQLSPLYMTWTSYMLLAIGACSIIICTFILVLLLSRKLAADQVLDMGLVVVNLTLSLMIAIVASLSILTSGPAINIPVVNILMAITILTVIYATSLTVVVNSLIHWQTNVKGTPSQTFKNAYITLLVIWAISISLSLASILSSELQVDPTGLTSRPRIFANGSIALQTLSRISFVCDLIIVLPPPFIAVLCYRSIYYHLKKQSAWVRKAVGDASTSRPYSPPIRRDMLYSQSTVSFRYDEQMRPTIGSDQRRQSSIRPLSSLRPVSRPTTLTQSSSITMYPQPDYLFSLDIGDYSRAMRNSAYRGGAIFILYIVFIMPLVVRNTIWGLGISPSSLATVITYGLFALSTIVTPLIFAVLDRRVRQALSGTAEEEEKKMSTAERRYIFKQGLRGQGTEYAFETEPDFMTFFGDKVDEDAPSYLRSLSLQRQSMPRQQRHVQQRPQSILQLPPRRRSASPPKLDTDQLIVLDPALAFSTRSLHTAPSVFTVSSGNSPGMLSLSGHPSPAFTSIEKETRKAIYITKALDDVKATEFTDTSSRPSDLTTLLDTTMISNEVVTAQSTPNDLSVYASSGPSLILNPNPPSELGRVDPLSNRAMNVNGRSSNSFNIRPNSRIVKEVSRQRNDKVAKNLITTRQVPTLPLMDSVQDAPTEKTFTPDVSYDASRNEIIPSVTGDRSDTIYSQVKQRPARPTAYRNAYRAPTPAPTPISQADQQERIARPSPPYLDSNYKYGEYPILTKRPTPQNNSTYSTKKSQPLQPGSLLPPAPIESSVQLVPKPEQEQRRARPATLYQDLTPVPTRLKVPTSTFQRDSSAGASGNKSYAEARDSTYSDASTQPMAQTGTIGGGIGAIRSVKRSPIPKMDPSRQKTERIESVQMMAKTSRVYERAPIENERANPEIPSVVTTRVARPTTNFKAYSSSTPRAAPTHMDNHLDQLEQIAQLEAYKNMYKSQIRRIDEPKLHAPTVSPSESERRRPQSPRTRMRTRVPQPPRDLPTGSTEHSQSDKTYPSSPQDTMDPSLFTPRGAPGYRRPRIIDASEEKSSTTYANPPQQRPRNTTQVVPISEPQQARATAPKTRMRDKTTRPPLLDNESSRPNLKTPNTDTSVNGARLAGDPLGTRSVTNQQMNLSQRYPERSIRPAVILRANPPSRRGVDRPNADTSLRDLPSPLLSPRIRGNVQLVRDGPARETQVLHNRPAQLKDDAGPTRVKEDVGPTRPAYGAEQRPRRRGVRE
ncbi:hypothetical protein BASA50_007972 [Batrachochytrium salamandrivorans]|uniref:G-protein coupled receptors family 1 profile domain-containing protein n=1 Tax=Batrachochytrium salamandrivorans TaxID=1357716 RepID=A0ABQ8F5G8_9FUNG|nr:hypothetical protein BASA62_007112 [Batrachochytrium salamandrivorans]KAH6590821.1 hypothetical protein BASA61_005108 [Batrachochytrium salamandrivorans]KAH6592596.1 hypothetical protein BASA50_007972 [Batrachochytrium salamandrivorans]